MSFYIVPLVVTRGATQCPSMSLDIKVSPGLCTRVFDWAAKRARIERGVLVAVTHPLSSHPLVDQTGADNPTTHAKARETCFHALG